MKTSSSGSARRRSAPPKRPSVGALVEYLKANPEANVEILGYADAATGSHAVNLKISRLRAEKRRRRPEEGRYRRLRISAEGRGDTRPAVPRRREKPRQHLYREVGDCTLTGL
ncbi:MAG: OmpA family protein [Alistipes finegoldii]